MAECEKDVCESHDILYTGDFIVIDVETTGRDVKNNRIVQLAMIKVRSSGEVDTWCKYFNPCMPRESQLDAFKIHKISPDLLLRKKTFRYHYESVMEFIGDVKYFVGHNILFDWNYLHKETSLASCDNGGENTRLKDIVLIDTYKTSISSFPHLTTFRLENLAKHLDLVTFRQPVMKYGLSSPSKNKKEVIKIVDTVETSLHDALTDAMITKELLHSCLEKLSVRNDDGTMLCLEQLELSHPQFIYPVHFLFLTDKLLSGHLESTERARLTEFAGTFMSPLPYTRGKLLKDIPKQQLAMAIQFLDSSLHTDVNDERHRALMDLLLSQEESTVESKMAGEAGSERKRKDNIPHPKINDYFPQKKARVSDEAVVVLDSQVDEVLLETDVKKLLANKKDSSFESSPFDVTSLT